eukprot:356998-Chlamydomonas_euryale.AAC.1
MTIGGGGDATDCPGDSGGGNSGRRMSSSTAQSMEGSPGCRMLLLVKKALRHCPSGHKESKDGHGAANCTGRLRGRGRGKRGGQVVGAVGKTGGRRSEAANMWLYMWLCTGGEEVPARCGQGGCSAGVAQKVRAWVWQRRLFIGCGMCACAKYTKGAARARTCSRAGRVMAARDVISRAGQVRVRDGGGGRVEVGWKTVRRPCGSTRAGELTFTVVRRPVCGGCRYG